MQFIQLWKTVYDMLSLKETDQTIFHALAVVGKIYHLFISSTKLKHSGTLLLQVGESYREYQAKIESEIADAMKSDPSCVNPPEPASKGDVGSDDDEDDNEFTVDDYETAQCKRIEALPHEYVLFLLLL